MDLLASPHTRAALACVLAPLVLQAGIIALAALLIRRHLRRTPLLAEMPRLHALPWLDVDAIFLLALFMLVQVLAGAITAALLPPESAAGPDAATLPLAMQVVSFPVAAAVVLLALARRRGIGVREWLGAATCRLAARRVAEGALYFLALMPFVAGAALFANRVLHELDYPIAPQPVIDLLGNPDMPGWLRALIVVFAVTLVPIVEECVFRGVFLPLALRRVPPLHAVAACAFIFAALHMHIPSLAPLFALAAGFSLAYLQTGSLLVCIVMHGLFNAMSLAILFLLGPNADLFAP